MTAGGDVSALEPELRRAGERLSRARSVTVMTGAGVSAASGIPTYRGAGGIWRKRRAEDLATPEGFARDPQLVWEWYQMRRQQIAEAEPNRAHEVLADWSRRWPRFTLVTQNVDGLHERAGTHNVVRFHGSLWEVRCLDACADAPDRWRDDTAVFPELPPRCPHCAGMLRPGVVWFGEGIDPAVLEVSTEAASCDVFVVVGTSALVYPAAGLIDVARRSGAFTVEVNAEPTPASERVDVALGGDAGAVLDALDRVLT